MCEVGGSGYVVNFRYGKRGSVLKDGTKTASPVTMEKAQTIYDKLVESKKKKGYIGESEEKPVLTVELPDLSNVSDSRVKAILSHLELGVKDPAAQAKKNWNIKRVMWRAGELRLAEALPFLVELCDKGDDMHKYCAIWAMGRCGTSESSRQKLSAFWKNKHSNLIKRITAAALLDSLDGEERNSYIDELLSQIPTVFRDQYHEGSQESFSSILNEFLFNRDTKKFGFLAHIYLLSSSKSHFKVGLVEALKKLPFKPPYFKVIRYIFKLAEYRGDGQIAGLLAYRFEKERPYYSKSKYSSGVWAGGRWISNAQAELSKSNSKLAYSQGTKSYFTRRVMRMLSRAGDAGDANYVGLATGILLSYSIGNDYTSSSKDVRWSYSTKTRRFHKKTMDFDSYSAALLMNHILYTNSPRYVYEGSRKRWRCQNGYKPGMPTPEVREEGYPELWDKTPKAYIHLLAESDVERILEFALKGFRANAAYASMKERIGNDLLARFVRKDHKPTVLWGLELAKEKYDPNHPDRSLTLTMLGARLDEVRALAREWISANYDYFFTDTDFVKSMMTHRFSDIRNWVKEDMATIAEKLTLDQKRVLVARVISYLLGLSSKKRKLEKENAKAKEQAEMLLGHYSDVLSSTSMDVILDLINHPLDENKKFAGQILLNHQTKAEDIPSRVFTRLIRSQKDFLRAVGIELFGRYPDATLLAREDELVKLATSALPDVREAVRPVIKRLAAGYEEFAEKMVNRFVPILLRKESYDGVHQSVYELLTQDLEKHLHVVERGKIFRLLNSEYTKAQETAVVLVDRYVPADTLSVPNIIRLANHEILAAREVAWKMFRNNVPRIRYEREEAIRLMDSDWDDTRAFAFEYFRSEYKENDWTPEILVGICDSVRPDVQSFGRELITRFFKEEHGEEYLLKLSQHPTVELQLFATNYLERFAKDDLDKLKALEFFFVSILSRVNKGRVAKDRVLGFLKAEAMKTPEAAEVVARILERFSLTAAIGDKETCLLMMRDIHAKYPHVELPISLVE